jgi:SAM-dependent methyltransferase
MRHRATEAELIDLPDCDEARLFRTLDQFTSINRLFSRARTLLRRQVLDRIPPGESCHLVDLGSGACDIPVWLLHEARRRGLSLRVTAVDADARVVRYARERHGAEPGLEIREADALDLDAFAPFDFLFANHFLHHLPDAVLPKLLADATRLARRGVLFSDLHRSRFSYLAFSLLARFYRNSFARIDGLISIRKGFTLQELRTLAPDYHLRRAFPGRVIMTRLR